MLSNYILFGCFKVLKHVSKLCTMKNEMIFTIKKVFWVVLRSHQQMNGADPSPLLSYNKPTSVMLYPVLTSPTMYPVQGDMGSTVKSPAKGHNCG